MLEFPNKWRSVSHWGLFPPVGHGEVPVFDRYFDRYRRPIAAEPRHIKDDA